MNRFEVKLRQYIVKKEEMSEEFDNIHAVLHDKLNKLKEEMHEYMDATIKDELQ